ncbi:MAG: trypsin-like peptidase domain-containing protein [Bacteroidales bacterium]|nr:trypsin-like peptidase domain-containing protein [Bacteroidales bacterium]
MKRLIIGIVLASLSILASAQGYNSKGGTHKGYNTPYTDQYQQPSSWSGSGFAIGQRHVATNHHVVDGATHLYISKSGSEETFKAEVVTVDEEHDLAVIKVTDENFSGFGQIKYGFKKDTEDVGMGVFVLGYPLVQTMGTEVKLTTGVVSSLSGFQGSKSEYQISAPVQPGNSGGPLFNDYGELIGVINAKHVEAENVSYGVKLSYLYDMAKDINGVTLDKKSQIADMSLSEKCKEAIPFTVMITADNARTAEPQARQSEAAIPSSQKPYAESYRSYPVRINMPAITGGSSDESTRIIGVELTESYAAVYMNITNRQYQSGSFSVNRDIYISVPSTGEKYRFVSAENCSVSPEKTEIAYGQNIGFTLYFEPIPANTSSFDLIEPGEHAWQFHGIEL